MDILKYNGYQGTAELDMARGICRGKILFITDVVTYEALSPANLQNEFAAAVEDYLKTCKALGREPQHPACGTFNVRISPELHRAAQLRAVADNTSLNEIVARSIDCYVNQRREVLEKHFVVLQESDHRTFSVPLSGDTMGKVEHVLQ